jgi:hypothetical protein
MVEHRRTPSRRAYHLPGWFFGLAGLLCALGVIAVIWAGSGDLNRATVSPKAPVVTATPTVSPTPTKAPPPERPAIKVEVLNGSGTHGLAARTAKKVEKAGWTVSGVGNWKFGAAHDAVYYPPESQAAAERLANDLGIDSVEPAKSGMRDDQLTVLVVNELE